MWLIRNLGLGGRFKAGLTLDMVIVFSKLGLLFELHLVKDQVPSGRGPVDSQVVVATDPLGADIRVHRNGVQIAVVGFCRHL